VQGHVPQENENIFYLTFSELHDVVRTQRADNQLIHGRKEAFASYQALSRPACSRRTATPSPGRTDATMCRPALSSAYRFRTACKGLELLTTEGQPRHSDEANVQCHRCNRRTDDINVRLAEREAMGG
jgi:hypothetical protein